MIRKKNKLMIVTYYYPPAGGLGLPGCMRIVKFVKYLQNWDVIVLTVKPEKYPDHFNKDYDLPLPINHEKIYYTSVVDVFINILKFRNMFSNRSKLKFNTNDAHYESPFSNQDNPVTHSRHVLKRLKDFIHDVCYFPDQASPWIPNAIITGLRIIKKEKPDIIFASGMPWSTLVIASILSKISKIPYVCDFRDPWIGNPYHKSKGWILDGMNKHLEKYVVKSSAIITANTSPLKTQIMHRYPSYPENKVVELPNGYDPDDFRTEGINIGESSSVSGLKLTHAGFLYGERNPLPILEAIDRIHKKFGYDSKEITFIQIGSMEDNIRLVMEKHIKAGYVECSGQIPHKECINMLKNSDILILIQQGTETQIPSKVYEYICLNKPIITITKRGGALWVLLEQNKFGDLFEPSDALKITDKIHEYYIKKKKVGRLFEEYPEKIKYDIRSITGTLSREMRNICLNT